MLTARQVVNELQKTGHTVAFIRRADGGIRIYNSMERLSQEIALKEITSLVRC